MTDPGDQLSTDDAAILALESEAIAGHTLKLCLLSPEAGPVDLEALRASVALRLAGEPRGRLRVEMAGGPESARWVEDEGFEIAAQIRRREGSEGIDEAQLWRIAGELMAQRLDHSRPLWAFDLIGPLADGREAIVVRIHHAMADGVGCVRFLDAVLWEAVEPAPVGGSGSGGRAAPAAPRHESALAEARRLPGALRRELGARATASPLDRPIGTERELAFAAARLDELKRIGASRPGHVTVNDVLLAGVAGGLREWLAPQGSAAPRLRAQIPVSLHHRDPDPGELGNRDSFLNVDLPLAEADPLTRLGAINDETARRKSLGDAEELYDFFHALARFKHLGHAVERLAAGPREFSLSISNVPGPRRPVGVAGRRVQRLYSVAEPADRHALRVSAISCAGELGIGLCTDPEAVPGVAALAVAIEDSLDELRAATIE